MHFSVTAFVALRRLCAALAAAAVLGACAITPAHDAHRPYDESADPGAQIAALLADNPRRQRILLTFGANWCSDSRALAGQYASGPLATLLEREFRVLHVDVGHKDRNLDVVERYGNPIDRGIPSVVVLDPDGKVLFVNHGDLSAAETMEPAQILTWFRGIEQRTRIQPQGAN